MEEWVHDRRGEVMSEISQADNQTTRLGKWLIVDVVERHQRNSTKKETNELVIFKVCTVETPPWRRESICADPIWWRWSWGWMEVQYYSKTLSWRCELMCTLIRYSTTEWWRWTGYGKTSGVWDLYCREGVMKSRSVLTNRFESLTQGGEERVRMKKGWVVMNFEPILLGFHDF